MTAIKEGILKISKLILSTITGTSSIEDNGSNLLFTTDRTAFEFNKPVRGSDPVNNTDFVTKQYIEQSGNILSKSHTFTADDTVADFFPQGYMLNSMLIENTTTGVTNVVEDPVVEDGVVSENYMGTYGGVAAEKKILFQMNPVISGDKADVYYTSLTRADYYSASRDLIVSSTDWAGGNLIVTCAFIKLT
jgi:hypothetical protein